MMKVDVNCKICNGLGHIYLGVNKQGKSIYQICNCYKDESYYSIRGYCPKCENKGVFMVYNHQGFSMNEVDCNCKEWSNFQIVKIESFYDNS